MRDAAFKDELLVRVFGSLVASHIILSINQDETLFDLVFRSTYYVDLFWGFVVSFFIWSFVRFINQTLAKGYDWMETPLNRLVIQGLLGLIVPSLMSIFFTYLLFTFFYHQDFLKSGWLEAEYMTCNLIILVVNFYYLTTYLIAKLQTTSAKRGDDQFPEEQTLLPLVLPESEERKCLSVMKGTRHILLPFKEVAMIYKTGQLTLVKGFTGEIFSISSSLDRVATALPGDQFFRANRKFIIHAAVVSGYSSIENGKIALVLLLPHKEEVIVSQKNAKAFRNWIKTKLLLPA